MNNERRTFWPLLAAMMLLLTATLILTLKLERQPSMQRPVSDITYQQHWELDDVLQEVLNLMRAGRFTSAQSLLNAVLKEFPLIAGIRLRISKPSAPRYAELVTIEVTRGTVS